MWKLALVVMTLTLGCGKEKPSEPTEREIAKAYEDAVVSALKAKWSGLDVRVGDRSIRVVAATCDLVLPVVEGIKAKPPQHQIVECGFENAAPTWRLIEHFDEMKPEVR